jgi:LAS superfamily LD-carboxypeptidase LdcB
MKIYNKFFIDTKYLPANYPDNADFLIKGIEHRIENNKWTTNVSSIVISQGTYDTSVKPSSNTTGRKPTKGPIGSNGNLAPASLKSVGFGNNKLAIEAANAFIRMAADIKKAGLTINLTDSYRTFEEQDRIFDWPLWFSTGKAKKLYTHDAAAYPGTSNHGLGKAIDIGPPGVQEWIRINGVKYGWSWYEGRSVNEPWHFTYDPSKTQTWPNGPMQNGKKP